MLYTNETMERERVHRLLQPAVELPARIIRERIPLFPSFPRSGAITRDLSHVTRLGITNDQKSITPSTVGFKLVKKTAFVQTKHTVKTPDGRRIVEILLAV